ncbi:MAG: hypothetical protein K6G12_05255 [Lachnospiraceae bacterium]|nr:hypothetical protein [Lachnospiraceae bacterium]
MAKQTLSDKIRKKQSSINANTLETKLSENEELANVIDMMAADEQYADQFETGSFSKEEVIKAAKFALQAEPYDISVTHLDVSDSPIYYKANRDNKMKSRGRFTRKDLDKLGHKLITRAKEVQARLKTEAEENKGKEITKLVSDAGTMDVEGLTDVGEDAVSAYENRNVEDYDSSKLIDNVMNTTDYTKHMDSYFEANLIVDGYRAAEKETLEGYSNIINSTLDREIPSLTELKKILDKKIIKNLKGAKSKYSNEGMSNVQMAELLNEKKAKLVETNNAILAKYKVHYEAVRKGEIAPEVLKLFLNTAIMSDLTEAEHKLYKTLVDNEGEAKTYTKEQVQSYKDTLKDLAIATHSNDSSLIIRAQDGYKCKSVYDVVLDGMNKGLIPRENITDDHAKEVRLCVQISNSFIHFSSKEDKETSGRVYINCKPGEEEGMLKAWWAAIKSNAKFTKLYFKINGIPQDKRKDKIVLYVPDDMEQHDLKTFLDTFDSECKKIKQQQGGKEGETILADKGDSMATTTEYAPGISLATEPNVDLLKETMNQGWYDKDEYDEMLSLFPYRDKKVQNTIRYSYNTYVNKAMVLSTCIAKKKLNLKPTDKVSEHKDEIVPLVKKYFADFMKLAGMDPKTMGSFKGLM